MPRKKDSILGGSDTAPGKASMRPGHCAPEKARAALLVADGPAPGFNEAGALCPGKRTSIAFEVARYCSLQ